MTTAWVKGKSTCQFCGGQVKDNQFCPSCGLFSDRPHGVRLVVGWVLGGISVVFFSTAVLYALTARAFRRKRGKEKAT